MKAAISVADKNADNARTAIDANKEATASIRQMSANTHALVDRLLSPRPDNGPGGDGDEMAATIEGPAPARRAT